MKADELRNYFRAQQVSQQWSLVLRAVAAELSETAEPQELRQLFQKFGMRLSKEVEELLQEVKTLKDLESTLNIFLGRINWGWVRLSEVRGGLDILHCAAPLAEAFGEEHSQWTTGLLEGFYQNIFHLLDPNPGMTVIAVDDIADAMQVTLRYGRHRQTL